MLTTAFAPAPGAQYVSGAARFAAAPQVNRYERQTALIDVADADASYVFDVLRVAASCRATAPATRASANALTHFVFALMSVLSIQAVPGRWNQPS